VITQPDASPLSLIWLFVVQMVAGGVMGYLMGRVMVFLINRTKLGYEGLYPLLILAMVFLTFGLTDLVRGSGFLAVYVAGLVLGNHDFIHKRSLMRFNDGLAWLMQITMFLTLGLFVFPSELVSIAGVSLLVAACLMLVARPLATFAGMVFSRSGWRVKTFVSWVGLRGAVPVILATFPLLGGVPQADMIFNVIFFVVLTSVLLQGTSIPLVARWLGLDAPLVPKRIYPIEYTPMGGFRSELKEIPVPPDSAMVGKPIVELRLPEEFLVILIARENDFVLPSGGTIINAGDTLLVLSDKESLDSVVSRFHLPVGTVAS